MYKVILLFFCLFSGNCLAAQSSFSAPLVKQSLMLDIVSGEYAVSVGERGHVMVSNDQGHFSQVVVPTQATLTAVAIVGDHIWAAGHDAVILHSGDRGQHWQVQMRQPDLQRPFLDIAFFNEKQGIAVGAYGLFYRTEDGGEHWVAEQHSEFLDPYDKEYLEEIKEEDYDFYLEELNSILPHLNNIRLTGVEQQLYIAGEAGLLAKSDDMGKSWQRLPVNYPGSFFAIDALPSGTLVAAGLRGNIFVSSDGEQWQYLQTCNNATLNAIVQKGDGSLRLLGNSGVVVTLREPFELSQYDPYATAARCQRATGVNLFIIDSKAALLNAAKIGKDTYVAAADGIYVLPTE